MGRPSKPWYRADRDVWVVKISGKQYTLAKGEKSRQEATRAFHALSASLGRGDPSAGHGAPVATILEAFLEWIVSHRKPITLEFYQRLLGQFARHVGVKLTMGELKPYHVEQWLETTGWNPTTRANGVTAVKHAMNWAVDQGYLDRSPLTRLKRPRPARREKILTQEQAAQLLASATGAFHVLLVMLRETGARPSEILGLEAKHLRLEEKVAVLEGKTTGTTGRDRTIRLTPAAVDLCRRLAAEHPEGALLRNESGRHWQRNACSHAFRRARRRLGMGPECTAESYRHLFVTDGLQAGLSTAVVAELVGHTSTAMIMKHYSHIADRKDYLDQALAAIRPAPEAEDKSGSQDGTETVR